MLRFAPLAAVTIATAVSTLGATAQAESGALPCIPGKIVEVFPGTEECPAAQYVVLESKGSDPAYSGPYYQLSPLFVVDHCGGSPHAFGMGHYDFKDASIAGTRYLFARSEAESLFGIQADSEAQSYLSQPSGRLEFDCWMGDSTLIYGDYPGSMAPALPQGKALAWDGSAWVLKDPAPVNSNGETGSLGTCPSDAGVAGTGGSAASGGGGGYTPCSGGGGGTGGASGGTGGFVATGGTSSGGTTGPSGGSGAVITDAGPSTGDGGSDDGCGCRAGPRSPSGAWLLLMLALLAARRSSRPIASASAPL